jgi:hypothetical protein
VWVRNPELNDYLTATSDALLLGCSVGDPHQRARRRKGKGDNDDDKDDYDEEDDDDIDDHNETGLLQLTLTKLTGLLQVGFGEAGGPLLKRSLYVVPPLT